MSAEVDIILWGSADGNQAESQWLISEVTRISEHTFGT